MTHYSDQPERPRAEPEIIPPDRSGGRRPPWPTGYVFTETHGTHRVYAGRVGPFGFALLMLIVALLGGILVLTLIGAALIWIPLVAVFVLVAAISGLLRRL